MTCWVTLTALGTGVVAALIYYYRVDDEIRAYVQKRLSDHYSDLSIQVGGARLFQGEGIRLTDISVRSRLPRGADDRLPGGGPPGDEILLHVEEIFLRCAPSAKQLLQGKLHVKQIQVRGLAVQAVRDEQGRWNLQRLFPLPRLEQQRHPPPMEIKDASLVLIDRLAGRERKLTIPTVTGHVQMQREPLPSAAESVTAAVRMTFQSPEFGRWQGAGLFRTGDKAWTLAGQCDAVKYSSRVFDQLPYEVSRYLASVTGLEATGQARFRAAHRAGDPAPRYWVSGSLRRGHFAPGSLPSPLTDLSAQFLVDQNHIQVTSAEARFAGARLQGQVTLNGHSLDAPIDLTLTAEQLTITHALVQLLPSDLQRQWARYQPLGRVSGQMHYHGPGGSRRLEASVDCHSVSLLYERLPYPIERCRGRVTLLGNRLGVQLDGVAGSTPLTIRATVHHVGPAATGWCEVRSTESMRLDEGLIAALPPATQRIIEQLQFRGKMGFWVRAERTDPALPLPPPHAVVLIEDGRVSYERFPYPIQDITGRLEWRDGDWTFSRLTGWNDNCYIECDGTLRLTAANRPLDLTFHATNVPLEQELHHALPPTSAQLWSDLRLGGTLQQVSIQIHNDQTRKQAELDIRAVQQPSTGSADPAATVEEPLSMRPVWFPYPVKEITGSIRYRDGQLTVQDFAARHGDTRIRTHANGIFQNDGSWSLNLAEISVDSLRLDETFLSSLPQTMQRVWRPLQPHGEVALSGAARFGRSGPQRPLQAAWDLQLILQQVGVQTTIPIDHLYGQVDLRGNSRGSDFQAAGMVDMDSAIVRRVQLTRVRGPIHIDQSTLRLGRPLRRRAGQSGGEPLRADVYGGRMSLDAEFAFSPEPSFQLQAQLTNVQVDQLANQWKIGRGSLAGQARLELTLSGSLRRRHTIQGYGTAALREANLYELPIVLAVINRLSSGRRDNAAFTASDVSFRIRDGYVYFDRFDLRGDTVTLKGIGEMSLNQELDLDFYTIVGREQLWSPLVRPFLGEASRQFLQIHVAGTLANPRARQEVLPGLNETLQRLFPEATGP